MLGRRSRIERVRYRSWYDARQPREVHGPGDDRSGLDGGLRSTSRSHRLRQLDDSQDRPRARRTHCTTTTASARCSRSGSSRATSSARCRSVNSRTQPITQRSWLTVRVRSFLPTGSHSMSTASSFALRDGALSACTGAVATARAAAEHGATARAFPRNTFVTTHRDSAASPVRHLGVKTISGPSPLVMLANGLTSKSRRSVLLRESPTKVSTALTWQSQTTRRSSTSRLAPTSNTSRPVCSLWRLRP